MTRSQTVRWVGLALLGLAVAVAVAIAASRLASRSIGLASEPIDAGRALAPAPALTREAPTSRRRPGGQPAGTSPSRESTPPAGGEASPPETQPPAPEAQPPVPEAQPQPTGGDDGGGDVGHGADD